MAEQKQGWFKRLTSGLTRTTREMTEQVTSVLVKKPLDQDQLDQQQASQQASDAMPRVRQQFQDESDHAQQVAHERKGHQRAPQGPAQGRIDQQPIAET